MTGTEYWEYGRGRASVLYMVIMKSPQKIVEQKLEGKDGASGEDIWRNFVPGRRHSRCRRPDTGARLMCLKTNVKVMWPSEQRWRQKELRLEGNEGSNHIGPCGLWQLLR